MPSYNLCILKKIWSIKIYLNRFIFSYIFIISSALHIFTWIWVTVCYFLSSWQDSYKASILTTHSLTLLIFWNVTILPLFLKYILLDNYPWQFLKFLTILWKFLIIHCLLFLVSCQLLIILLLSKWGAFPLLLLRFIFVLNFK
jgi:hypothetical protein